MPITTLLTMCQAMYSLQPTTILPTTTDPKLDPFNAPKQIFLATEICILVSIKCHKRWPNFLLHSRFYRLSKWCCSVKSNFAYTFAHRLILYELCGVSYLSTIFEMSQSPYDMRDKSRLVQPKVNSTSYGLKSFKYYGSHIWNLLPMHIKSAMSLPEFKELLTTWSGPTCKCSLLTVLLWVNDILLISILLLCTHQGISYYVLIASRSDARHFYVLSWLCIWMFVHSVYIVYMLLLVGD